MRSKKKLLYLPFQPFGAILLIMFYWIISHSAQGQKIHGLVYEQHDHSGTGQTTSHKEPLPGVNVYWTGTTQGTVTDDQGKFELAATGITDRRLVFSLLGFRKDTLDIGRMKRIELAMVPADQLLPEVEIKGRQDNTFTSKLNPVYTQVITTGELHRAACCNLAESFETNAAVDVSFSDAVTGARQIQMLGLSGIYSQIMAENIPMIRGLASAYGLSYVPGSWMESIQVSKGTSSVTTGAESITGQINVEYKKPATSERIFLNLFGDSDLRFELNGNGSIRFNDKLSTMLLIHGSDYRQKTDHNHDGFMDMPLSTNINLFNRWDYINPGKYISRFGIKYLYQDRQGGQMDFDPKVFSFDTTGISDGSKRYGVGITTNRTEAFWKNGFFLPGNGETSIGLILYGLNHLQTGYYGINQYSGHEQMFYGNLILNTHLAGEEHKLSAGITFMSDAYNEHFLQTNLYYSDTLSGTVPGSLPGRLTADSVLDHVLNRSETMTGFFMEYTVSNGSTVTAIIGGRIDYLNTYGWMYAPRFHFRYQAGPSTIIRASAGVGYRVADVLAENSSVFVSQRRLLFPERLDPEIAWNYGINLTHDFHLFNHKSELSIDLYRTDFISQVIADLDSDPTAVSFLNLDGRSFSNSIQAQFIFAPVHHFTVTAAFRYNDVRTTINGSLQEKPLVNRYKGLLSLSYYTNYEKWQFDFTAQVNGPQRLPDSESLPPDLRQPSHSPAYINLLAQITRRFKYFDVYLGGENLTNYRQKDPIQQYWAPYANYFDGSKVWGPVMGIKLYAGFRYTLK